MKKLLTITLAMVSVIGFAACGTEVPSGNQTVTATKAVNNPSDKSTDGDTNTDKGQDSKTDKGQDTSCEPGFFGPECKPCTCVNGACNDGKEGDGSCACEGNWSGDRCDQCNGNFWGSNCDQKPTCKNGTPSLGINGTGLCTECEEGWYGADCGSDAITCVNGTPNLGINGDGTCKAGSCATGYAGVNCDACDDDHYGEDCEKQYGTMTGRDGKTYKTVQIGDQTWMAENMADQSDDVTCYANTEADPDFVKHYGCLYNWYDAMKVCPEGWRLPTIWDDLTIVADFPVTGSASLGDTVTFNSDYAYWGSGTVATYWDKTGNAETFTVVNGRVTNGHAPKALTAYSVRCLQ